MRTKLFLLVAASLLCAARFASAEIDPKQFSSAMGRYLASPEGRAALGQTVEDYFRTKQEQMKKAQEDAEQAQFEEQFKNPVKIEIGSSPVRGPANAKVTIIEFSDFQCPYCRRGKDTMEEVLKAYPKDVKIAFKNMPLGFHKEAMPAAKAAYAAGKQGKFWEMHDALFANQGKLGDAFYESTAKELGLNMEKFKADMAAPATEAAIRADMSVAEKNGIQGTPGFFVGGVAVKGAYPFDRFKMIIDRLLGQGKGAAPAK